MPQLKRTSQTKCKARSQAQKNGRIPFTPRLKPGRCVYYTPVKLGKTQPNVVLGLKAVATFREKEGKGD